MGLTYLFISHNLSVVKHCCQRIGVMYLGRIVELAPSARIYENAGHPYTQALISAIPKVEAATGEKEERILLGGDLPSPTNLRTAARSTPAAPTPPIGAGRSVRS